MEEKSTILVNQDLRNKLNKLKYELELNSLNETIKHLYNYFKRVSNKKL